jgi:hypothetical protein
MSKGLTWWIEAPNPSKYEEDNVWEEFHLFDNEWVEIQNRKEWYESPNVPMIYKNHKYIFDKNMGIGKPEETFYKENVDSHDFHSEMDVQHELPSGRGMMRIKVEITTKYPPSGENDFAMVEYLVDTELKYDMPNMGRFLPRFLAYPLANFYKWAFMEFIAEEMIERDGEYAIEKTREYFQYIRKYHGEEPTQTRSRQAQFTPLPESGIFFE